MSSEIPHRPYQSPRKNRAGHRQAAEITLALKSPQFVDSAEAAVDGWSKTVAAGRPSRRLAPMQMPVRDDANANLYRT